MSDVSMAKVGWLGWCLFLVAVGIMWVWDQIPVLIRRGEYRRLRENDLIIQDAHRAIGENHRLRVALAKSEPRLEDCDLSHL